MHVDEVDTDADLVRRLIAAQFPEWAALPITPLAASGTVNALFRLGDDMVVRLPRRASADVSREHTTLGRVSRGVPVIVPTPLAVGRPAEGYPWSWCVDRWLLGEHPVAGAADGLGPEIARFIRAVRALEPRGAPPVGRGWSLARFNPATRGALDVLAGAIDTEKARRIWDSALATPAWTGSDVWVHGDLMPANLLVQHGHLTGVLDWGGAGVGDPAVDLMVAWNLLTARARDAFRAELEVDDASWARGIGWALWTGLVALPYYTETNQVLVENARYRIGQVLADATLS